LATETQVAIGTHAQTGCTDKCYQCTNKCYQCTDKCYHIHKYYQCIDNCYKCIDNCYHCTHKCYQCIVTSAQIIVISAQINVTIHYHCAFRRSHDCNSTAMLPHPPLLFTDCENRGFSSLPLLHLAGKLRNT
uniref:Uncharacterized protein n=1 Tax=Amphilophus citrinellus TaxID=61819 RepID=A0A3Q0RZ22_AMPCI